MKTMSAQGTFQDTEGGGGVSDDIFSALEDTLAKAGRRSGSAAPKGFKMSDMGAKLGPAPLSGDGAHMNELMDDDAVRRSGRLKFPNGFSVRGMDRR